MSLQTTPDMLTEKAQQCGHTICAFLCSVSGVSIEFLCFPRPEEPIEHVMSCLQALCTLLDSPCAKMHIAEDQVKRCDKTKHLPFHCKLSKSCSKKETFHVPLGLRLYLYRNMDFGGSFT